MSRQNRRRALYRAAGQYTICESSGKRGYFWVNVWAAIKVARVPMSAYHCLECRRWHLAPELLRKRVQSGKQRPRVKRFDDVEDEWQE